MTVPFGWLKELDAWSLHLWNWIRDGHELGARPEGRLDLNERDHFGNALHDVSPSQDLLAELHHLGDRFAVSCGLEQRLGDQRNRLGKVQLEPALLAPPGQLRDLIDHELLRLA